VDDIRWISLYRRQYTSFSILISTVSPNKRQRLTAQLKESSPAAPWPRTARRAPPTPCARRVAAGRTGCARCPRSRPSPARSSPGAPCRGRCPARSGWSSCTTAPCRSRSPTRGPPRRSWRRRRRSRSTSASSESVHNVESKIADVNIAFETVPFSNLNCK
jgi:hypothetical protein